MTHYTVVVFDAGEKVDKLVNKYDENISVPEYSNGLVDKKEIDRCVSYYIEKHPEFKYKDFDSIYSVFGENWNGNCWRKNENGEWEEFTTYNPDSKYDYYIPYSHKLPEFVPFAFVTPDGVWHEKGHMGWWAISWDEKPDEVWEKEYKDALAEYKGTFTILDCHI